MGSFLLGGRTHVLCAHKLPPVFYNSIKLRINCYNKLYVAIYLAVLMEFQMSISQGKSRAHKEENVDFNSSFRESV
jgi:hypothetical protein